MPDPIPPPHHSAFAKAVCLDLPYILDSVWRRAEFNFNRLVRYDIDPTSAPVRGTILRRPYTHVALFWFFLATLMFVAYGPTFDAWCSIVGVVGMRYLRATLGGVCLTLAMIAWGRRLDEIVHGVELPENILTFPPEPSWPTTQHS